MNSKKLTKVLVVLLILLVILLFTLIYLDSREQSDFDVDEEDVTMLKITEVEMFSGFDERGNVIVNTDYVYAKGSNAYVSVKVEDFTNPKSKSKDGYFFGLRQSAEVLDEEGNKAGFFGGIVSDVDNYLDVQGEPAVFTNQFEVGEEVEEGMYYLTISVYDKISKIEAKSHVVEFKIV